MNLGEEVILVLIGAGIALAGMFGDHFLGL